MTTSASKRLSNICAPWVGKVGMYEPGKCECVLVINGDLDECPWCAFRGAEEMRRSAAESTETDTADFEASESTKYWAGRVDDAIAQAVAAEREACAKVCDDRATAAELAFESAGSGSEERNDFGIACDEAYDCAAAIRARANDCPPTKGDKS
jgi:hypothetical protein